MSNLLKQRYVINLDTEKVIINADERYASNVQNAAGLSGFSEAEYPGSEEILDGFLQGLEAEEVFLEPQITPEELLEQARAEADQILAVARAEAARIANEASHEAELQFENQKLEGYKAGFNQSQAELEEEKARIASEYQQLEMALKEDYDAKFNAMEADIVDAVIRVFNHVFNVQFENKRQILLHLIKDAVLNIESSKEFRIRVAESNFKFVESHVGDIKEKVGNDVSIELIKDTTLGDDDCMIETQYGVYNCGVDMELSNLEKDIRSLCR